MKRYAIIALMACAGAALAVLGARAACVDCGTSHPNGCEHNTTQGNKACADGAATCDGASHTNCVSTTGKEVNQFPKVIADSCPQMQCEYGSTTNQVSAYEGHHYISNATTDCDGPLVASGTPRRANA